MEIVFRCTFCGCEMANAPEMSGAWVACPSCGVQFQMPSVVCNPNQSEFAPPPQHTAVTAPRFISTSRITSRRHTGIHPIIKTALLIVFVAIGSYLGIFGGLWIVRGMSQEAYHSLLRGIPVLHRIGDRLP